jgi:hypothetical protein
MCATIQEIMNGNHLWNDRMTKGNTICPRPFHGGGIKRDVLSPIQQQQQQKRIQTFNNKNIF